MKSHQKNILLVEDEAIIALDEKTELEKYGYHVLIVHSGEHAIKTVDKSPDIDLILMDINLGSGMDGTETAETILKKHDLPILFLSSHTEKNVVEKTESITSYGYVVKRSGIIVLDASIKMAFRLFEERNNVRKNLKDLKKTEEALLRSEETLKKNVAELNAIINALPGMVSVVDTDFNVLVANDEVYKRFGQDDLNEVIGKKCYCTRKGLKEPCPQCNLVVAFKTGKMESRVSTPDEEKLMGIATKAYAIPLKDQNNRIWGGVEVIMDISDIRKTEQDLRNSKERMQLALEGTDLGLWDWNIVTGEVTFNDRWAEMLGYRLDEIEPHVNSWEKLVHPDDLPLVMETLSLHLDGKNPFYKTEHRMRSKKGHWIWVQDRGKVTERDNNGKPVRAAGTHLDISDRKEAECEIKRQLMEKEILLKEAHHRIKNNIASIEALLKMQTQSIADHGMRSMLKDAIGRVQSMRVLYEKLLTGTTYQSHSVREYLESLIDSSALVFWDRTYITIEREIHDFNLDAKQLFPLGIITNELLTNSMKYAFEDRSDGRIRITLNMNGKHITFIVEDNGLGLPRGFDIEKTKGFGLTIVKMLAEQLGGTFYMESHDGTMNVLEFDL
ncbi:PAS domain-containing protein [bacterium]|nr:PAS domain-containing protein [bacterium]